MCTVGTGTVRDKEELKRRRRQGLPASTTGLPWLIVAPASVARVWMEHLETWGYFSTYHLESGKEIDVRGQGIQSVCVGGVDGGVPACLRHLNIC